MRIAAALFLPLLLAAASAKRPSPDAAVHQAIADQVAAWNRGDLEAFCAVYAEDALFLSPSGVTRGRTEVYERYKKKYGTDSSGMGTLSIEPFETRIFKADGVSVAAKWTLRWEGKEPATGHTLIVFRPRLKGGWELVQDASM